MNEKDALGVSIETGLLTSDAYSSTFGSIDLDGGKLDNDVTRDDVQTRDACGNWAICSIVAAALLVVTVTTTAIVGWSLFYGSETTTTTTTTSSYPDTSPATHSEAKHFIELGGVPEDELRRIDCYPESAWGVDMMTPDSCQDRGCVYQASTNAGVPWCYVPQTDYGYRVTQGPIATPLGERWILRRKNTWGIYDENFENVTFDIEMWDDNMLRFQVSLY